MGGFTYPRHVALGIAELRRRQVSVDDRDGNGCRRCGKSRGGGGVCAHRWLPGSRSDPGEDGNLGCLFGDLERHL